MSTAESPMVSSKTWFHGTGRRKESIARVFLRAGSGKFTVNGRTEIHRLVTQPYQVLEFDLPADAAAAGTLELEWRGDPNKGGAGRGCQVSEVWLIRK